MIRKLWLVLMILGCATLSFASLRVETAADSVSASLTTPAYTTSFPIMSSGSSSYIGAMYKSDVATGDTVIYFQQSFQRPTTENAADDTYVNTEGPWTVNDGAWHQATIDSVVMPYGRFLIKGSSSNPRTTTIDIKVSKE
jgi:hypothetical protein